jgi:fimbrial isopeptide formation D2 family protein/LPXTG-motif cell wall-anchored protein
VKTLKGLRTILFMVVVFAIMAVTALADDAVTTYTVKFVEATTQNAKEVEGNYYVYKLATGDYTTENVAKDIKIESAYKEALIGALGLTDGDITDADIINKLASVSNSSSFASTLYGKLVNANATITSTKKTSSISGLEAGYYLIVDKTNNAGAAKASTSKHILLNVNELADKADNKDDDTIYVEVKSSFPSFEKKVKENSSNKDVNTEGEDTDNNIEDFTIPAGYNDVADYDTYTDISFLLVGTLPSNYADYTTYKYQFVDELGAGFDYVEDSVKVYATTKYATDKLNENNKLTADGNYTVGYSNRKLTVTFANLKSNTSIDENTCIVVTYTAKLNKDANVGSEEGNINKAYLVYSNNPNFTDKGTSATTIEGVDGTEISTTIDENGNVDTTGKTVEDQVIVFTYNLTISKVDASDSTSKLGDAVFHLEKDVDGITNYASLDNGVFKKWVTTEDTSCEIKTVKDQDFEIKGLDEGEYSIVEDTAPTGYNKLSAPVVITITADTINKQNLTGTTTDAWETTGLTYKNGNDTLDDTTIVIANAKGSLLPTTGGIGTTILYVIGGILVICAGVALITKKRMKDAE